jgi:ribosome-associated protein
VSKINIVHSNTSRLSAAELRDVIEQSLDEDKAEEIAVVDLAGKCDYADYMIVASGRSQRHVSSLGSKLAEKLREINMPALSIEGQESGEWVLIDTGDIIVHLFHPEKREFYNLEKMWEVPMPAMVASQPELNV